MDRHRVLLVGTGAMGHVHANAWRALGVHVACVVGAAERAASLAARTAAHTCPSVKAAVERHPEARIVDVSTSTERHLASVEALDDRRCLLVMEKPLAATFGEARRVVDSASARSAALFPAQFLRFSTPYRSLHDRIAANGPGAVRRVDLRRLAPTPPAANAWVLDEALSGGLFVDLAVHDLDWLLWTFGEPVSVRAQGERPQAGVMLEGWAEVAFAGGAQAHIHVRYGHDGPLAADARVEAAWGNDATGTEADAPAPAQPHGTGVALPAFGVGDSPFVRELRAALTAFARSEPLPVTAEDGLVAVRLAALCRQSAQEGRPLPWSTTPA